VYKDGRTWRQRVTRLQENWAPIIKDLTQAYLTWKYPSDSPPNDATPPSSRSPSPSPSSYDFDIECIDLYTLSSETHIQRNTDVKTVSEALVLNGYIGATPQSPSIAISLRTLKLYRRIRLRKPSFSAEAFTKVLCDLYNVRHHHIITRLVTHFLCPLRCLIAADIERAWWAHLMSITLSFVKLNFKFLKHSAGIHPTGVS
jgi:hypothetical protein